MITAGPAGQPFPVVFVVIAVILRKTGNLAGDILGTGIIVCDQELQDWPKL